MNGDGSAVRDFVHVDDMADAFVRALDACEPGALRAYNIGSGRRTTISDVVATAEQVTGRPVPVRHAPPANEPPVLVADSARAEAELGWRPARSDLATSFATRGRPCPLSAQPRVVMLVVLVSGLIVIGWRLRVVLD